MKMLQDHFDEIVPSVQRDDFLTNFQVIDATPAARWFFAESAQAEWDIADDFPTVASPWPSCWMEFVHPGTERIGKKQIDVPFRIRSGAMILSYKIPEDKRSYVLENYGLLLRLQQYTTLVDGSERFRNGTHEAIKRGFEPAWMQMMKFHLEINGRHAWAFAAHMYLDADGKIDRGTWFNIGNPQTNISDGYPFATVMFPFLFTLSLLHCKNVKLEDVAVPPKVQAKREKRGVPNITFKTLVVEPMRQQVRRETAQDPTGEQNHIRRALHIARGHFKDYRNGPGLFGKYQGLYWWDMHVRGSADAGLVVKDYQVRR